MPWTRIALALALALAPVAGAQDTTGITGELERTTATSPQEKVVYADEAIQEIRQGVAAVSKLLEEARKEGDPEALECLTTRLAEIRKMLAVTEAAQTKLNEHVESGDARGADFEFRKIAIAKYQTRRLVAESEQCVADGTVEPGVVALDVSTELLDELDPTGETPFDPLDYGFDPPSASPFQ